MIQRRGVGRRNGEINNAAAESGVPRFYFTLFMFFMVKLYLSFLRVLCDLCGKTVVVKYNSLYNQVIEHEIRKFLKMNLIGHIAVVTQWRVMHFFRSGVKIVTGVNCRRVAGTI